MNLTGAPKATFSYPRFTYGSPALTLDIPEPASRIPTVVPVQGLRGSNIVSTGKAEYLFGRNEEQVGLVLRCEQDMLAALRWAMQDSWAQGTQFKAWVDRYTGSCWMFEGNRKDQNGLELALLGGSETYAAATNGFGLTVSTNGLSVASAQASASTATGYDDPFSKDEGVIVVDCLAGYAATDNSQDRFFVDTTPTSNCRLSLYKGTDTTLRFQIIDSSGTAKDVRDTVAWSSADRVQIVASWTPTGTLSLWYAVNGGAFTALTTITGAGSGIMSTLPTTLFVGAGFGGANLGLGTYDSVAIFKRAFSAPHLTLANYRPLERNHFPYAEVTNAGFQPARVSLGRTIWDWPVTLRNGQP